MEFQRKPGCSALLIILTLGTTQLTAWASSSSPWRLVFSDDFERTEIGEEWYAGDVLEIRGGRMLFGINRPDCASLRRSFPADVMVEFDAEAYEGRPPCDLSVSLAGDRHKAFSWNYLFQFGGGSNTFNRVSGGKRLTEDQNDSPLPEPGRVYHIRAIKEGTRLSLEIDGELLLDAVDEEIMGGPAFDRVSLVTWNGMYVDNFRAYERTSPHPDTPEYVLGLGGLELSVDSTGEMSAKDGWGKTAESAIAAYNAEKLHDAERLFMESEGELKAAGLAYVYGHIYWDERPGDFQRVAGMFQVLAAEDPSDKRIADYTHAALLFSRLRLVHGDANAASELMALGEENNPFYDKAKFYRARYLRAAADGGVDREAMKEVLPLFEELKAKYPEHLILRQLAGEDVPWGENLFVTDPAVPRWAALMHEMYIRQLTLLDWWFTNRQFADGQLGGGWGDDVELLRSWGPFALISDASPEIRNGIERLCQGVWDHALADGYSPELGDVEHSAEPSADTVPVMMMLRYGDPLWYERNLATCRQIRDYFTGIDDRGHVRFKSAYFGGKQASTHVRHGGDNYYCTRPMKHFLFAALYGNEDAKRFYLDWAHGWREVTMTTIGSKTAGVPPGNIWYPSGDIVPPSGAPWHDADHAVYGGAWVCNNFIHDMFLSAYHLSGDPRFLAPWLQRMAWYLSPLPESMPDTADASPDIDANPLDWAVWNAQRHNWGYESTLAQYGYVTGDTCFHRVFGKNCEKERLHLPGAYPHILEELEKALERLRVNFNLQTTEVLQTDRAYLPGWSTAFSLFTGAVRGWGDAGLPTQCVTWDFPDSRIVALVTNSDRDHLRAWIYRSCRTPAEIGLRLWHLEPGVYEVSKGPLVPGADLDRAIAEPERTRFRHTSPGSVFRFDLPPATETCVDFRLVDPIARSPLMPDPAVGRQTVQASVDAKGRPAVSVTIHNLGSAPVSGLAVALVNKTNEGEIEVDRCGVEYLPACADLMPATATATLVADGFTDDLWIVLDPDEKVQEICETNNRALCKFVSVHLD